MKVKIEIGDWSHDGHNQSEKHILEVDGSTDIMVDYTKGSKKLGFDLINDYCEDFEDNSIPREMVHKIRELGFELEMDDEEEEDDKYYIYTDLYLKIYLIICKIGNPEFEAEIVADKDRTIQLGGYGLFYC